MYLFIPTELRRGKLGKKSHADDKTRNKIGGRTAWSSRVTVNGAIHQARFWYDGKNLNNAKEDAAEVALSFISMAASPPASRRW